MNLSNLFARATNRATNRGATNNGATNRAVKPKTAVKHEQNEQLLRGFAALDQETLFSELGTTAGGLSAEQVEQRQEEYGANIIVTASRNTMLRRLRLALINPFNVVLLIIAGITFVTDVILSDEPDFLTVIIIVSMILLSAAVAFAQSQQSSAAAEKLAKMITNRADVLRAGVQHEVLMEELVPGDIVRLAAGDMIPADIRFLTTKDTFVAQAALTGESNPVEKFAAPATPAPATPPAPTLSLPDLANIGLMGSNVISGSATGVVLATNNNTYLGSMASSLSGDRARNSFERGVGSVSRLLISFMLVMVPIVLLINGITKGDWFQAMLFAISVAVGLTPEMLPVIMTSTLARGAVSMSRHKVIVKTLGAIQTFGEMDILCTDKTGTLTEDRIVLERYMDLNGEDDPRILRHAYLNSAFQTGLKNLLDVAIINRATTNGLEGTLALYERIDEIPFDFVRRRMSVVLEDGRGKRQLVTKGAVEEVLAICAFAEMDGAVVPLSDEYRRRALATYERHNAEGLRMIAVAQKNEVPDEGAFSVADETAMVLIGFVGFLDPPKASAAAALAALREHGVRTIVLTGDSAGVALKVCQKVGITAGAGDEGAAAVAAAVVTPQCLTGADLAVMDDEALSKALTTCNIFAKLTPNQKERVVRLLQAAGHTVGYLGDGINDAPPLHQSDVGISVDTAVDIAKETADIILLKKDLMVLEQGVLGGRRTFGNVMRYIKMAASGNFGNMFSVIIASLFLPFLPMLPVQILAQNLLCDFSQLGMPFDKVDKEYLRTPRRWETRSIRSFMVVMGPLSSIFDVLCFVVMWFVLGANTLALAPVFQAGWFVFGTVSQVLIIHMIRTARVPFLQSRAAVPLVLSTFVAALVALVIGFSPLAVSLGAATLTLAYVPWLVLLLVSYCVLAQLVKLLYIRRVGEWI